MLHRTTHFTVGIALAAACLLGTVRAHAEGTNMAAAEALFNEGRKLLEAGQTAEACRKLAESQRLDPSSGTLLNLASCHEQQGKTASAWAEYLSAARLAKAQGRDDRAMAAQQRADALEPQLSYLTLDAPQAPAGLEVKRNGEPVRPAELGARIPIDPGEYTLSATAPGYEPWEQTVTVDPGSDHQTVRVPPLAPAAQSADPTPTDPGVAGADPEPEPLPRDKTPDTPPETDRSSPPIAGYVIGGTAVVLTGVGAVFGVKALNSYAEAEDACKSHTDCSETAMSLRDEAGNRALVADVGVGLGVVGMAVGGILIATHRQRARKSDSAFRFDLQVGPRAGTATLSGAFR